MDVTLFATSTVYAVTFGENAGAKAPESTERSLRLALELTLLPPLPESEQPVRARVNTTAMAKIAAPVDRFFIKPPIKLQKARIRPELTDSKSGL
jgi:hypothetical protein